MYFFRRVVPILVVIVCAANGNLRTGRSEAGSGGTYLFPTSASHKINSGFADYRSSHFHAGIDISTNHLIGYPVFASKSGYVYRISVSPFGYGKMIVLRHDDSTFTVYGHLSDYTRRIDSIVENEQSKENRYVVTINPLPGEIRVERGEVIAYTGATGVGGPHLHFEIRDRDYSPIDPLIYSSLDLSSYRTPKIFGVAVRGFKSGRARVVRVYKSGKDYRARGVFRMNEPFFFIVHAADSYGQGAYKRPPKYIRLMIDGKDFLSLDLTRVDVDDDLDIGTLVDLSMSRRYKTYYKLCVDRAIPFSVFTPSSPASGLVDESFMNGTHSYTITVEDENGNKATLDGKFVLNIPHTSVAGAGVPAYSRILPFREKTISPAPGLTIKFPGDCFAKDVDVTVRMESPESFSISPSDRMLRRKIEVRWNVEDDNLHLFRRVRNHWSYVPGQTGSNNILSAGIGYKTGEFALIRDNAPPAIGRLRFSRKNPFYVVFSGKAADPSLKDFRRVFVYFNVSDRMSGVDPDDIIVKVGNQKFLCEYDVDKHAASCLIDAREIRSAKSVEVSARDNAGNVRKVIVRLSARARARI